MTRRNDKRNQRRTRNHGNEKPELSPIASMLLGALLGKGAEMVAKASEKHKETKPFNGIRNVSDNCFESGVCVPTDGTAKEIPVPKGFEIFISEDGKPMVRKKIKGDGEPQKEHLTYEKIADVLFHCSCFDIYGDEIFPAYKNSIDNCIKIT